MVILCACGLFLYALRNTNKDRWISLYLVYLCSLFFAILGLLIPDSHMVPDKDRSSPHISLPDAYDEGRSLSGFFGFLAVLMNP